MGRRAFEFGLAALASAGMVSAQTWSLCNPIKGDTCPPNPAFGGVDSLDFTKTKSLKDLDKWFLVDDGIKYDQRQVAFDAKGLNMIIHEENDAPLLISKDYIFFGKVDVVLQAAPGQGIVTSIVLQSDCLDEIDWEFIGNDQNHVQTNYYAKGVNDYSHARYFETPFNPMTGLHTYTFEWTPSALTFAVDGKVLRTATPDEGSYPTTPMQLRLGTWVGGKGGPEQQGTIDWAGGLVKWNEAPFPAWYKSVTVTDYAGGYKGAREYVYTDTSGTWESIKVNGGEKVGVPSLGSWQQITDSHDGHDDHSSSASSSAARTSTSSAPASTSTVPSTTTAAPSSSSTSGPAGQSGTPTPSTVPGAGAIVRSGPLAVFASALLGLGFLMF